MGCVSAKNPSQQHLESADGQGSMSEAELPRPFDSEDYATLIHDALENNNEDLVVKAIQDSTPDQREEISHQYIRLYDLGLLDACTNKLQPRLAFVISLLLYKRLDMAARHLHHKLRNCPGMEVGVLELMCCHPAEELHEISQFFQHCARTELSDALRHHCPEHVAEILQARLTQVMKKDDDRVDVYANSMVDSLQDNNLFEGKRLFQTCLMNRVFTDVTQILELFLQKCQRSITVEIEKHYEEGDVRIHYSIMARIFRHRHLYIAGKIRELLNSESDEDQMELTFLVLNQLEDDLHAIKQAYRTAFFETLSRDIKDEVKDPIIRRVLLRTVK